MEASREEDGNLLHKILPPRLEDAGLEDCALPPDSIKEAFLKAATAVRSSAASILDPPWEDPDCVEDPWASAGDRSDALVGVSPAPKAPGRCGNEKGGGLPEDFGDKVVVAGGGGGSSSEGIDEVVPPAAVPDGGDGCVEGLRGLKIEEEAKIDEDDEEEKDDERPILVETCV